MKEPFSFLAPSEAKPVEDNQASWNLLIVDDEQEVHQVTKLVLSDFCFEGGKLNFLSAYSKEEAIELLESHQDIALILLDVIMESDTAGLECVKYIREDLNNHIVRIVLRTGQPGSVPENEVMQRYDINDYKQKTELTKLKLSTSVMGALRSYRDLVRLESLTQELRTFNTQLEAKVEERTRDLQLSNQNLISANRKIENQQKALVQSEKMASLGQLAAGVAHEINNPLGFLKSNLDFLKEFIEHFSDALESMKQKDLVTEQLSSILNKHEVIWGVEESHDVLHEMELGVERIQRIVKELSIFFGKKESNKSLVDLHNDILEAVKSNLAVEQLDIQRLTLYQKEAGSVRLFCASNLIQHALFCLIRNALESSKDKVTLGIKQSQTKLVLLIIDKGEGIAENNIHRVFDPFYSTKTIGKHLGLGLTIAQNIIKGHGGEICIESKLGEGTQVKVTLEKQEPN